MKLSTKAQITIDQINSETKLGDLRKIAKNINKDHSLALELWSTQKFLNRLLAILIMDHTKLTQDVLNSLDKDMRTHMNDERNQLVDWLMANQLTKDKPRISLILSWEKSASSLQRRVFWYYQGRLRWTGRKPFENTTELLTAIEVNILNEEPEVQWAMNFTAGWIGVFDEEYRDRCVQLGEKTGLYKGDMVSKGCTPSYSPQFIDIEVDKRRND